MDNRCFSFDKIPEDFTRWDAGENPVPGKTVKVIYRDGAMSAAVKSEEFTPANGRKNYWKHEGGGHFDIIAYKVMPTATKATP